MNILEKILPGKIKRFMQDIISKFKIAKTPSYIDIDYEDIEDSQIIASAKALNAKVITRDKGMFEKYSQIAITPKQFLEQKKEGRMTGLPFDLMENKGEFFLLINAAISSAVI